MKLSYLYIFLLLCTSGCIKVHDSKGEYPFPKSASIDPYASAFLDLDYVDPINLHTSDGVLALQNRTDSLGDFNGIEFFLIKKDQYWINVAAWHTLDMKFIGSGRIDPNTPLFVFLRNYNDTLETKIYETPSFESRVSFIIPLTADPVKVIDFDNNKWIKIEYDSDASIITGWIPPISQCADVYTTCN